MAIRDVAGVLRPGMFEIPSLGPEIKADLHITSGRGHYVNAIAKGPDATSEAATTPVKLHSANPYAMRYAAMDAGVVKDPSWVSEAPKLRKR